MIKVIDNFLSDKNFEWFLNFATTKAPYWCGSKDRKNTPATGMVSPINLDSEPMGWFNSISDLNLHESYINCFAPNERPYFHTDVADYHVDKVGMTGLYYINDRWNYQDGGETQFLIDDEIRGIPPIPNRLVCFDSNILHKATPFRDKFRFTLALKYGDL